LISFIDGSSLSEPLNSLFEVLSISVKLLIHVLEPIELLKGLSLIKDLQKIRRTQSETIIRNKCLFVVSLKNFIFASHYMLNEV
jgi:hypothetical protein